MRYLFINSVAGFGSTGRIIAETCRGLQAQGHECLIAYGREKKHCDDVPTYRIGSDLGWKAHAALSRVLDDSGFHSRLATETLLKKIRAYDPDVIWLHNLHGYYLHVGVLFSYLRTCGKPIFWTLHDCWSFTGHCAYFDYVGCEKWKIGCHHCPEKKIYPASLLLDGSCGNYKRKKKLFTGIPQLKLIVPSNWLASRVQESFLKEYPVTVSYHKIDEEIFRPVPSDFRKQHGLESQKILLGVASVWDRRKGLEDFLSLRKLIGNNWTIVLVGLTKEQIAAMPEGILGLPRTKTPVELAEIYSAADVYVNPGVEETFGMTVLEAASCGTTPLVYAGSACAEVAETFGGLIVARGPENLARALKKLEEEND